MALYSLDPVEGVLHSPFSRDLPPVLTINPGDTVRYCTIDAGWNRTRPSGQDRSTWDTVPGRDPERGAVHPINGPVALRGAKAGMTLVVHIEHVEPGEWGWNHGYDSRQPQAETAFFYWDIDKATNTARNQLGQVVPLKPFMGVMGMPADLAGDQSTAPPRFCGGNIDCKELVAGSTLYLPIAVDGALFSTGDGHAVQGDGEVSGTAIECPMDRVDLRFDLRDDLHLQTPRAQTPAGWITLGFDPDLNIAYDQAMWAMIDLMGEQFGISPENALSLASLVVEMRVTQRVNGTNGVHALLPSAYLSEDGTFTLFTK